MLNDVPSKRGPAALARKRRGITEPLQHLSNIPFKLKGNYNHLGQVPLFDEVFSALHQ